MMDSSAGSVMLVLLLGEEEYADLLERLRLIVSPTACVIRSSEPAEESMICFLDPLHQARFSDYNQRMRSHCLSKSGGFHGDATG